MMDPGARETTNDPAIYLKQLELGPMQNFVYLVGDPVARQCVVVDPAWEIDTIVDTAAGDGMTLTGALVKVDNHDTLDVGRLRLTFLHTPGHTPGSQCFLVDGRLISGDTLFIGSCGRTDLPGSDPKEMYYSLTQRLAALPDDTILLPGHNYGGAASTIGREKRQNRFMQFSSLGNFLAVMGAGRLRLG